MKKAIVAFAIILTILSCKKSEKINQMVKTDWLIGTWENNMEQGRLSETWEKTNDSTLSGKSYFIREKDTLNNETIFLTQKDSELFYTATVKGQNNDQPVVFKMTKGTTNQLVFENPEHDFPKRITYTLINKDSLVASISGTSQGKPASETYPMKRK